MIGPVILIVLCLLLLGLSIRLFLQGVRKTANERVLSRLAVGQPQATAEKTRGPVWSGCSCGQALAGRASTSGFGCRCGSWP